MKLVEDSNYDFDTRDQVFSFSENGRYSTEHIKFLRLLAQNQLEVVSKVRGADTLASDCSDLALSVAKV